MAANMSTNPFEDDDESEAVNATVKNLALNRSSSNITYEDVANKLLKDHYLLTALELYTELAENGRESHRLRDYFSNPSNFERNTQSRQENASTLERTSSVTTFDSLDFARYSDDGDRQVDEKVAVLEFELRKAKETIKSLRANLTEAAESDPNLPESNSGQTKEPLMDDLQPLKPHELRALNFLVNEYLLKQNYKLTSITFADENESQDFEDWDDVGLNISKPPELLHLYRDYGKHHMISPDIEQCDVGVQIENCDKAAEILSDSCNAVEELMNMRSKFESLTQENAILTGQIKALEYDLENIVSQQIKSSTPSVTPIGTPMKSHSIASSAVKNQHSNVLETDTSKYEIGDESFSHVPTRIVNTAHSSLEVEPGSNIEDCSVADDVSSVEEVTFSNNKRKIPAEYKSHFDELCYKKKPLQDPRLSAEVSQIVDSHDKVVLMLARCLPHIIPNVILAKREELIPVLLGTISMHPCANERDNLLHLLFNLIKRPGDEQRQVILSGFMSIACRLGPTRVESELLPQCWEQLNHKYIERRLLVAESCGVLAPHIPAPIRNSLVVSMLRQILSEEKVEEVRVAAVRSLAVIFSLINDLDKINLGLELFMETLMDSSDIVVDVVISTFLPILSLWLLDADLIQDPLLVCLLKKLTDLVMTRLRSSSQSMSSIIPSVEERKVTAVIASLQSLIPYLFVSVIKSGPYTDHNVQCSDAILELSRFPRISDDPLHNPLIIHGNKAELENLLVLYDEHVAQEWYKSWSQLDWLHNTLLPDLISIMSSSQLSCMPSIIQPLTSLLSSFCRVFGRSYTITKVIPLFQKYLIFADVKLDQVQSGNTALTQFLVPVYACGVLSVFSQEEDRLELQKFLCYVLTTLSLCNSSIQSIQMAFAQLCEHPTLHELLLTVLWEALAHTSVAVRFNSAKLFQLMIIAVNQTLLSNRVIPALVTFASDSDMSVRTAVVESFGIVLQTATNAEILEKVKLQFQTFLDDAISRDHHPLHLELIHTFSNIAPNLDPIFREEFILPRLAAIAFQNNNSTNETRRLDVALALLEAYSTLTCCSFSSNLIKQSIIPGLKCLLNDVRTVSSEHENAVVSMIREFEAKSELMKPPEQRSSGVTSAASSLHQLSTSGMEDMKNKMSKYFAQHKPTSRPNISNIFQMKKK